MCIRDRREAGLAGYWRLGGVALEEDGSQRVFDFSVNANHGEVQGAPYAGAVSYTHLRAHETVLDLVCRLLLEKKKKTNNETCR